MYQLLKSFLFKLDPEKSHNLALKWMHLMPSFLFKAPHKIPQQLLGYTFDHPVGLAAGLDKNAQHIDALARLGFSFIEVGTVTPRPQLGNAKPRMFRLPESKALINRMGFNNHGVDELVENIQRSNYQGILGINIGKNKETPIEKAVDDYLICLKKVYSHASYITVNISSPNTPDLRDLHHQEHLSKLISELRSEQLLLSERHQKYVPLLIKVSPDETNESLKRTADIIAFNGIDGIIATNTTNDRAGVEKQPMAHETGGLSGAPLKDRATASLKIIRQTVGEDLALIASGGVTDKESALEKIAAGANLVQLYTGLIYEGPALIHAITKEIARKKD